MMNWTKIALEHLNKPYKPNLKKRTSYYESKPLRQIQIDTAFFTLPNEKGIIPVLVIVDDATKYVRYYKQARKNESIARHLKSFMKEVRSKFKNSAKETIIITYGVRELVMKNIPNVKHYVSTSKNGVESAIARARRVFHKMENEADVTKTNFQKMLDNISKTVNKNVKYEIDTPVFAIDMNKFYPDQTGYDIKKKNYLQNWLLEPFGFQKDIRSRIYTNTHSQNIKMVKRLSTISILIRYNP